nr:hypothetical protein Iba_chr08dCG14610 [Ipomoea batatas]
MSAEVVGLELTLIMVLHSCLEVHRDPSLFLQVPSGGGVAKSQPPGPVPAPQAPRLFGSLLHRGLNAKQRKRLIRKLKKQKGKSVVVDKSPEGETSGVQPWDCYSELGEGAARAAHWPGESAFSYSKKLVKQAPTPASSIQADVSRPQADSDVPRAGQEADLEGSGFETDQELYLDQSSVPCCCFTCYS